MGSLRPRKVTAAGVQYGFTRAAQTAARFQGDDNSVSNSILGICLQCTDCTALCRLFVLLAYDERRVSDPRAQGFAHNAMLPATLHISTPFMSRSRRGLDSSCVYIQIFIWR